MAVTPTEKLRRAMKTLTRSEVQAYWRRRPVDEHLVFLESFDGNGAICNPEPIFRALVADPAFSNLRFVWSLRAGHDADLVLRDFAADARVTFVLPSSPGYSRALATAKYLVTNATFPRWFNRREGQIVLNTWHGTPLKKMGFDIDDRASRVANVVRNFLHADYLLSTGEYMTDVMYRQAHELDGFYDGRILEAGSPRVDAQFAAAGALAETRRLLQAAGIDPDGRRLVLFAPTWKGVNFLRPADDAAALVEQARELQELLGDGYRVAVKAHQAVHKLIRGSIGDGLLVPNDIPANAILAVTDHLVTDYSSIFFDFLPLERPIHFFVPDLGDYDDYRGLYLAPETWPGELTATLGALADAIREPQNPDVVARARAARSRFAADEDGAATARVVDVVFRERPDAARVVRLNESARTRMVLVVGGPPDAWSAVDTERTLAAIDLDAVDLTVVVSDSRRAEFIAWQRALDRRIRIVVRQGALGGSKLWALWDRVGGRRPAALWREEWHRIFGLTRVDSVQCLSTGAVWVALAAAGVAASRESPAHLV